MSDDRYRDAFLREIDGLATPRESADLKERLKHDPAARREFDEMTALRRLLDTVQAVDPPADLKAEISRAVRHRERVLRGFQPRPEPGPLARLSAFFSGGGLRYAAVLGVAAVAVFTIAVLRGPERVDAPDLTGSMAPRAGQIIDSRRIELTGVRGTVDTKIGERTVVEIRLDSDQPVRLDILASPNAWTIESEMDAERILTRTDRWTIQHEGSGVHRVILKPGTEGAPFRLRITSGDETSELDLGTIRNPAS